VDLLLERRTETEGERARARIGFFPDAHTSDAPRRSFVLTQYIQLNACSSSASPPLLLRQIFIGNQSSLCSP